MKPGSAMSSSSKHKRTLRLYTSVMGRRAKSEGWSSFILDKIPEGPWKSSAAGQAATDDQEMKDESGSVAAAADDATAASGIPDEDVEDALLLCPPVPEDDDVPINADLEWETTASKLREAEKSAAAADAAERKAKAEPYDNPLLEHVRITQLRFHIIV